MWMAHHVLRILLGLVFVAAGLVKLMDITTFTHHVGEFGIVFDSLVPATAWLVSLAEVITGVGLLVNRRGSLLAAVMILLVFLSVLVYGLALGLDIDCGCFGTAFSVELKYQLLIDLGLVGWCGLVHATSRCPGQRATDAHASGEASFPEGEAL